MVVSRNLFFQSNLDGTAGIADVDSAAKITPDTTGVEAKQVGVETLEDTKGKFLMISIFLAGLISVYAYISILSTISLFFHLKSPIGLTFIVRLTLFMQYNT